jgi:hypothetical protein
METPTGPGARDALFRTLLLVVASAAVLVLFLIQTSRGDVGGPDVFRFLDVAGVSGPWRDVPIEYAPGEFLLIRGLFDSGSAETAAVRLAIIAFAGHLATWGGVRWGWGRSAGLRYLIAALPLLLLMYERIDLVPVALAAWGLALAVRGRARGAGAVLAIAVLTKLWPIVLVPGIVLRGGRRAGSWFAGIVATGALGWVAYGGWDAPRQVMTFRGARGWEVGSTVGALVWIFGGGPVREEAGSGRVGVAPMWAKVLLGLLLLALLSIIWIRARARHQDPGGPPALASIAALLLCTPLFSTQYAMWLLPWAGVTSARDDDRGALAAVLLAGVCTAVIDLAGYNYATDWFVKIATLIRVGALAWLVGREVLPGLRPRAAPPQPRASSPRRSAA